MATTYTFNAPSGDETIVSVTFTDGTNTHTRDINAVFTNNTYDATATDERVQQHITAIENKWSIGKIIDVDDNSEI